MKEYIYLSKGDEDLVGAVLKENGVGADLTGTTVKFSMRINGTEIYSIDCTQGAIISSGTISYSYGGVTIPFTSTHTSATGVFEGKFIVSQLGTQISFPNFRDTVEVHINE